MKSLRLAPRLLVALFIISTVAACDRSSVFGGGECPDPPALAASEPMVALSCAPEVTFEGRTYSVSGGRFDTSWIGQRIAGQGEGEYEGAYELRTFPVSEVIALRVPAGQGGRYKLAFTEGFEEADFRSLQEPFGDRAPLSKKERRDVWTYAAVIEATHRGSDRSGQIPMGGGRGNERKLYVSRELAGADKNDRQLFPARLEKAVATRVELAEVSFCLECPVEGPGVEVIRLSAPIYRKGTATISAAKGNGGCEFVLEMRREVWQVLERELCYIGTGTPESLTTETPNQ